MGISIGNRLLGSTGLSAGLGLSRSNRLYFSGFGSGPTPFSPAELFLNGEPGVWYDPSDFTTLFQDAAGTTPVTAVEQPVGLMLDKSKGLTLGSELVTNGTFSTDLTGWTVAASSSGSSSWVSGAMQIAYTGGPPAARYQALSVTAGITYKLSCSYAVASGTNVKFYLTVKDTDSAVSAALAGPLVTASSGASGSTTFYYTASATRTVYLMALIFDVAGTVNFDDISVKSLAGNHATQATSAARPVLSARVNLLTKTEQFDDAVWLKEPGVSIPTTNATAPDGSATADRMVTGGSANTIKGLRYADISAVAATYTATVRVKDNGSTARSIVFFFATTSLSSTVGLTYNFDTDAVSLDASSAPFTVVGGTRTALGSGWYQLSFSVSVASAQLIRIYLTAPFAAAQAGDFLIWGADLRVANDTALPVYQRVNTATDYAVTGFPYYLRFDGTDDSMATASINFTSTAQMSVFAGVRKLSDAGASALQVVSELSSTIATSGSFAVYASNGFLSPVITSQFASRGTSEAAAFTQSTAYAAPFTEIMTGLGDISGDRSTLRVNGVQAAINTGDQGTGNYGNHPLYVGARAGSSFYLNGRLYSLIVRGAATTDALIGQTEQWISGEMGGGFVPTGYDFLVDANGDFITDASGNPLYTNVLYS